MSHNLLKCRFTNSALIAALRHLVLFPDAPATIGQNPNRDLRLSKSAVALDVRTVRNEMNISIWIRLLIPALVCGLVSAVLSYWVVGEVASAAFVVGACVLAATAMTALLSRNEQEASAQLRNPELRGSAADGTGIFGKILTEALSRLERCEAAADDASRLKTELEARTHVRQKQILRLDAVLQSLDDPVMITDARGRLQYCNHAASRLFQSISDQAEVEQPDLDVIPDLKQLFEETRKRNAATDTRTTEFECEAAGEPMAFRATATNVYDQDGTLLGVAAVLCDIREERVAKTRHAEFVSSVSHELKTPMASIKAFVELLQDGDVTEPEEQKELYGFIDSQIDRLTRLVNNMLNLARIESGVIKIQREDCELNDVLHNALSVVQPMAEEKQIRVISELSELYMAVHIDKDMFGQAIINLLSNAAKYTPEGGEIRLRSRMEEGQAVIEVRDTGMGMPEDSLPHIFDRFYRVPENNKAAAGTGLGLALVHYIVTGVHNGNIDVESTVNEGTCFLVTVPLGHRDQCRMKHDMPLCTV